MFKRCSVILRKIKICVISYFELCTATHPHRNGKSAPMFCSVSFSLLHIKYVGVPGVDHSSEQYMKNFVLKNSVQGKKL